MAIPVMSPAPGKSEVRFVGDTFTLEILTPENLAGLANIQAFLRTNLGHGTRVKQLIAEGTEPNVWRDIPMKKNGSKWSITLALCDVGVYQAKAYLLLPSGIRQWPEGPDFTLLVHPDSTRTGNTLYCAFTRLFGATRQSLYQTQPHLDSSIQTLDAHHYHVIPPSGTFRDLLRQLPHIFQTLHCKILHLLPIHPTPTTYARFGRFGSPYACQDLLAIDPALVEFDRTTTGLQQFEELTHEVHRLQGQVFIDIVINHTGWGSVWQENHPEWFLKEQQGPFISPGAWGTTWEDLVELNFSNPELLAALENVFLTWCRRGVDGFRCDAGYKIPAPIWRRIIAAVQLEFPNTVFLLEGLGGSWEATEKLLKWAGMHWAYSELFQEYSYAQFSGYLGHALPKSIQTGALVHYSETHDNTRLAEKGKSWSLLRNQLSALTSVQGGFGFTCGVEWLATEKIRVHGCTGLNWNASDNIVQALAQLNSLLQSHPCFFDGAHLTPLCQSDSKVYALARHSLDRMDSVLILINPDPTSEQTIDLALHHPEWPLSPRTESWGSKLTDLLGGTPPPWEDWRDRSIQFRLPPSGVYCLTTQAQIQGLHGVEYRNTRARVAWAFETMANFLPPESFPSWDWKDLAQWVHHSPAELIHWLCTTSPATAQSLSALPDQSCETDYQPILRWSIADTTRVVPVPLKHWILLEHPIPFQVTLRLGEKSIIRSSVPFSGGHFTAFPPSVFKPGPAQILLQDFEHPVSRGDLILLPSAAEPPPTLTPDQWKQLAHQSNSLVLLTNGQGAMSRLHLNWGKIFSKYDGILAANLHPDIPVDRHVFVKRLRAWIDIDGFHHEINADSLIKWDSTPYPTWHFSLTRGILPPVSLQINARFAPGENTVLLAFHVEPDLNIPPTSIKIIARVDIEDRNFHMETLWSQPTNEHFHNHTHPLAHSPGFRFTPSPTRQLWVSCSHGDFHHEPEWAHHIPHPNEQTRGHVGSGDAYSPGWFHFALEPSKPVTFTFHASLTPIQESDFHPPVPVDPIPTLTASSNQTYQTSFPLRLRQALDAFVVQRGSGKTVIAGYPWFLDWGRDTLIAARGLLAAGLYSDVEHLLVTFGKFVDRGTLPNIIHGEDASNRDTSDAPLWYGIVAEEFAQKQGLDSYDLPVRSSNFTLRHVLHEIAQGYIHGTPNGIRMDPESGLIWSPSHFTWMDTNHPPGTPRQGYPVEIQALWIRLLRQLARLNQGEPEASHWSDLAELAWKSTQHYFWREDLGYYVDLLIASDTQSAAQSVPDNALRSNCLWLIALDLAPLHHARACLKAIQKHLLIPGALRSLAPLPIHPPLAVFSPGGHLLNHPEKPYWGRYEGDEDTRRKPAYHNGTGWAWTFPSFCESLVKSYPDSPLARETAQSYLLSLYPLLDQGCLGHLPEVMDGDAPHTPRGCDAQAWSVSEALRVWLSLTQEPGHE